MTLYTVATTMETLYSAHSWDGTNYLLYRGGLLTKIDNNNGKTTTFMYSITLFFDSHVNIRSHADYCQLVGSGIAIHTVAVDTFQIHMYTCALV